ncbi:MAG: hypothetical protein FRX49_07641 [Trebouxia sp. A1-2]|nr:MAG: hypothetical protein FRX49_07641 [Trebouxia sp. A1-2]
MAGSRQGSKVQGRGRARAGRNIGRNAIHATASFDDVGGVEGVSCQQLVLLELLGHNRVAQQVADDIRNLAAATRLNSVPFGVVAGSGSAAGAGLGDAAPGEEKGVEGTIGDGEASEDAAGVGDWDGDGVGDVVVDGKASGDGLGDGNACRAEAGDGKASGDGLGDGKACGAGAGDGKASGDGDALDVLAGTMAGSSITAEMGAGRDA